MAIPEARRARVEALELLGELADRLQARPTGQRSQRLEEGVRVDDADRILVADRPERKQDALPARVVCEQEQRHRPAPSALAPGPAKRPLLRGLRPRELDPGDENALGDPVQLDWHGARARQTGDGREQLAGVHGPKRPAGDMTRG